MRRLWNLKTQFLTVLCLLLLGALLLQSYVHGRNEIRLLAKVQTVAQDIANEVVGRVAESFRPRDFGGELVHSERVEPGELAGHDVVRPDIQARRVSSRRELQRTPMAILIRMDPMQKLMDQAAAEGGVPSVREIEHFLLVIQAQTKAAPSAPESMNYDATPILPTGDEIPLRIEGGAPRRALLPRQTRGHLADQNLDITPHVDEIRNVFEEYRRSDLIATVAIFLCGIAAALYLSFRMTRPVYNLVGAFQRVSDGDLEARVPENATGEFIELNQQFNRMVSSLQENRNIERELALRERVQHMGDLAAGVAHDVRNPLNAIHLNMGQIRDEFLPEGEDARRRFLRFTSDAQTEVERLNQLVSNFLSLAQPSSDEVELVSPGDLVEELVRLLEKEAVARSVQMHIGNDSDLPEMSWDRQAMKSAFLNVAMNALQAMEPDGGRLEILTGSRGEFVDELAVTFVDTGRGMSVETLDKVFVPYFTTRAGGTGLGLAIARRIAERHGGRLELRSKPGEGTSVSFVFPLSRGGEAVA